MDLSSWPQIRPVSTMWRPLRLHTSPRLAIHTHSLVFSIFRHILPQTSLPTTPGSPRTAAQQSCAASGISPSTPPIEPLFGTTALFGRIVVYRFSTLFRTFHCLFSHQNVRSFFPLPYLSLIRPRSRCRALETTHSLTFKSGYRTLLCESVAGKTDSFQLPFSLLILLTIISSVLVSIA